MNKWLQYVLNILVSLIYMLCSRLQMYQIQNLILSVIPKSSYNG